MSNLELGRKLAQARLNNDTSWIRTFEVYPHAGARYFDYQNDISRQLKLAPEKKYLHFSDGWICRDGWLSTVPTRNLVSKAGVVIRAVFRALNNRAGELECTYLPQYVDYTLPENQKALQVFMEETALLNSASKLGVVVFPGYMGAPPANILEELMAAARVAKISNVSIDSSFPVGLLQPLSENQHMENVKIEIDAGEKPIGRNVGILSACQAKRFRVRVVVMVEEWICQSWRAYTKCINKADGCIKTLEFGASGTSDQVWDDDKAAGIVSDGLRFVGDHKVIINGDAPIGRESCSIIRALVATSGMLEMAAEP